MSIRSWPYLLASLAALSACGPGDADDDGLTNKEEKDLGLDPKNADFDGDGLQDGAELEAGADPKVTDSDADGLDDGDEIAAGSDPLLVDSDGDGYRDGDEVTEGKDPADADSVIYKGGWPYVANKDALKEIGVDGDVAKLNKQFARFVMKDQFRDEVDLYDFYNLEGKPVLFDVSAQWCPPCQLLAEFFEGNDDFLGVPAAEVEPAFFELRTAIENGDAYWITIMGQQNNGDNAVQKTAIEWYDDFPADSIPVLVDPDYSAVEYVQLEAWPTVIALDGELKAKTNGNSYIDAMCKASTMLGFETHPEMGWCLE